MRCNEARLFTFFLLRHASTCRRCAGSRRSRPARQARQADWKRIFSALRKGSICERTSPSCWLRNGLRRHWASRFFIQPSEAECEQPARPANARRRPWRGPHPHAPAPRAGAFADDQSPGPDNRIFEPPVEAHTRLSPHPQSSVQRLP